MSLLDDLAAGTVVEIETTLLPKFTLDVGDAVSGPQGLVTEVLRPKITIRRGSEILYGPISPAGDPAGSPLSLVRDAFVPLLFIGALVLLLSIYAVD